MRVPVAVLSMLSLCLLYPLSARSSEQSRSRGYSLELIDESGNVLPTFENRGRTYVLGTLGRRYSLRLRNSTGQRVEFVASVDGRDVLDGNPSAWEKRGYIVSPYGEVVIDGFRLSEDSVAAFRFSSVKRSYASRMGDARDVGVIGVAVFPERQRIFVVPPRPWAGAQSADRAMGGAPAAPSAEGSSSLGAKKAENRLGLGTEFGEQRESRVTETEFERAASSPAVLLSLRYDDCPGLLAMGVENSRGYCPIQSDVGMRENANPFRRNPPFSQPPAGWGG
jgi:hypothetical protein